MKGAEAIARMRELRERVPDAEWVLVSLAVEAEHARLLRELLRPDLRVLTAEWLVDQIVEATGIAVDREARAMLKGRIQQVLKPEHQKDPWELRL